MKHLNRWRIFLSVLLLLPQFFSCGSEPEKPDGKEVPAESRIVSEEFARVEVVRFEKTGYRPEEKKYDPRPYRSDPNRQMPQKKTDGSKWRIACLEGGGYIGYYHSLVAFADGLKQLGWIEYEHLPEFVDKNDSKGVWSLFLSSPRVQSEYVEFPKDAFYSAKWDEKYRKILRAEVLDRLNNRKDIDLVIAMGTWSGQDLASDDHSIPVVSMDVSDPIRAGIIKNPLDSGYDHFHTRVDPTRFLRHLELFHRFTGFKRLGVPYLDTHEGRSYAGIEDARKLACEKGFELFECKIHREYSEMAVDVMETKGIESMKRLASEVDAVYITSSTAFGLRNAKEYIDPILKNNILSFAQEGMAKVKYGALMGTDYDYSSLGRFHAEIAARIFNGQKPRELSMVFEEPAKLSLNLKTAELIGFKPTEELLSLTNKFFTTIEK